MVLRLGLGGLVVDGLDHGRREFLGRQAVTPADHAGQVARPAFGNRRDQVEIKGLADGARFLGPVPWNVPGRCTCTRRFTAWRTRGGPWFLLDAAWLDRTATFQEALSRQVEGMGYALHDVERHGEKGFHRVARGFCTRPDSVSMARYFLDRSDPETAARFRPSSMEFARSLGGDPLTLVSELPFFILKGMGDTIEPTDPVADRFLTVHLPAIRAAGEKEDTDVAARVHEAGLTPMPIAEQMRLQLLFLEAGLAACS